MENNNRKNSAAKIRANNKYTKLHYIRFNIALKPTEAEAIKTAAETEKLSIAQYFLKCHNEHIHKTE